MKYEREKQDETVSLLYSVDTYPPQTGEILFNNTKYNVIALVI